MARGRYVSCLHVSSDTQGCCGLRVEADAADDIDAVGFCLELVDGLSARLQHIRQERAPPQGACLALEYAARHAHRNGGLVGSSRSLSVPSLRSATTRASSPADRFSLAAAMVAPHFPEP